MNKTIFHSGWGVGTVFGCIYLVVWPRVVFDWLTSLVRLREMTGWGIEVYGEEGRHGGGGRARGVYSRERKRGMAFFQFCSQGSLLDNVPFFLMLYFSQLHLLGKDISFLNDKFFLHNFFQRYFLCNNIIFSIAIFHLTIFFSPQHFIHK